MISRLNAWQKFYGLFALALLASTFAMIATLWPLRDPGVIADLRASECQEWREIPEGVFPQDYPEATGQCDSIRMLLYQKHVILRTEDDYDRYRFKEGVRIGTIALALWTGLIVLTYLLGWSSAWLGRVLRAKVN
jgi:hypothetical protein